MSFFKRLILSRNSRINWIKDNIAHVSSVGEVKVKEPFINLAKYLVFFISGKRNSGKSGFGAYLAEYYLERGYVVFDIFSESDFENCYWVVRREKQYPCIFLVPPYVDVSIPEDYKSLVKVMSTEEPLEKILRVAHDEHRVIVFVNSCYCDHEAEEDMLRTLARFFNELPRVNDGLGFDVFLLIREISQLAGQTINIFENTKIVKRSLLRLVTGCRHHRISLAMDMQFLTMLFKTIRGNYDRVVIKRTTADLIPSDLSWFLDKLKASGKWGTPQYPHLERLFPQEYYGLYDSQDFFKDSFPLPKFRLKREKDNFELITGIRFSLNEKRREDLARAALGVEIEQKINNNGDRRLFEASERLREQGLKGPAIAEALGFDNYQVFRNWKCRTKKLFESVNGDSLIDPLEAARP